MVYIPCLSSYIVMSTSTRKDRKEDENTSVPSPSQIQREQQQVCQQGIR